MGDSQAANIHEYEVLARLPKYVAFALDCGTEAALWSPSAA